MHESGRKSGHLARNFLLFPLVCDSCTHLRSFCFGTWLQVEPRDLVRRDDASASRSSSEISSVNFSGFWPCKETKTAPSCAEFSPLSSELGLSSVTQPFLVLNGGSKWSRGACRDGDGDRRRATPSEISTEDFSEQEARREKPSRLSCAVLPALFIAVPHASPSFAVLEIHRSCLRLVRVSPVVRTCLDTPEKQKHPDFSV